LKARPPDAVGLLTNALRAKTRPAVFVLAGHNGSGKSTLWHQMLGPAVQLPLINADRLTMSMLPEPEGPTKRLPEWAQRFRDENAAWQHLSQAAVDNFRTLAVGDRQSFAYETVFSYWKVLPGGGHASKVDDIRRIRRLATVSFLSS